jgi:hypothetical protein
MALMAELVVSRSRSAMRIILAARMRVLEVSDDIKGIGVLRTVKK